MYHYIDALIKLGGHENIPLIAEPSTDIFVYDFDASIREPRTYLVDSRAVNRYFCAYYVDAYIRGTRKYPVASKAINRYFCTSYVDALIWGGARKYFVNIGAIDRYFVFHILMH